MMTTAAIVAQLTGGETGALVANRIYPSIPPQDPVYPLIVFHGDESEVNSTFDGPSGLISDTVHVVCLAKTAKGRDQLSAAVIDDLASQSGTWGGMVVQGAFLQHSRQIHDTVPGLNQDALLFQDDQQYIIWFVKP